MNGVFQQMLCMVTILQNSMILHIPKLKFDFTRFKFADVVKVYISFWFKNPDGLDTLSVSVSYGGPWYPIAEYSDPVEQYTLYCPITEIIFGILKIKFTVVEWWWRRYLS